MEIGARMEDPPASRQGPRAGAGAHQQHVHHGSRGLWDEGQPQSQASASSASTSTAAMSCLMRPTQGSVPHQGRASQRLPGMRTKAAHVLSASPSHRG